MLFVCFDAWVLDDREGAVKRGSVAGLLLALLRTEGIAWVVTVAALGLFRRLVDRERSSDGPVDLGLAFGAALAGYALYYAWRFQAYESWVSNTALAKVGFRRDRVLARARLCARVLA